MVKCQYCHIGIIWANRKLYEPNRIQSYYPYEITGEAIVIINESAVTLPTYKKHSCEERGRYIETKKAEQQKSYNERKLRWEALRAEQQKQVWAEHISKRCPKCDAIAGSKCINLQKMKTTGELHYTVWPHHERIGLE